MLLMGISVELALLVRSAELSVTLRQLRLFPFVQGRLGVYTV